MGSAAAGPAWRSPSASSTGTVAILSLIDSSGFAEQQATYRPAIVSDSRIQQRFDSMSRWSTDMTYSRRRFLETTGALAAAAGLGRSPGVAHQPSSPGRQSGAPGVQLNVDTAALPDYSRDLERYLTRLSNEARARRKQIIDAISTRQGVLDRQKSVVAELWKMLGGPLD